MIKKLLYLLLILMSQYSFAYANSNDYEVSLKDKYISFYKIINKKVNFDYEKHNDIHKAVEILTHVISNYPSTKTCFYMLKMIQYDVGIRWTNDSIMIDEYKKLKNKYYNSLSDVNTDTASKIVFMVIADSIERRITNSEIDSNKMFDKCFKGLQKIKEECSNKEYAALALLLISDIDKTKYYKEFLDTYQDHPLRSYAENGLNVAEYLSDGDIVLLIKRTDDLYEKYKTEIYPGGYSSEIEFYFSHISLHYIEKDKENVLKYYNLIKEKVPDYYLLDNAKVLIDNLK